MVAIPIMSVRVMFWIATLTFMGAVFGNVLARQRGTIVGAVCAWLFGASYAAAVILLDLLKSD